MNWKEHKKQPMKDPEFKKEYEALEPEYQLAATLIRLWLSKGLTQEELARILNTKQASIARLESAAPCHLYQWLRKWPMRLMLRWKSNCSPGINLPLVD